MAVTASSLPRNDVTTGFRRQALGGYVSSPTETSAEHTVGFTKAAARDAWVAASPRHDYHEAAIAARRAHAHQARGVDPELLMEALRQFAARGWHPQAFTEQAARNHVARLREERREAQKLEERDDSIRSAGLRPMAGALDELMRRHREDLAEASEGERA